MCDVLRTVLAVIQLLAISSSSNSNSTGTTIVMVPSTWSVRKASKGSGGC